MIASTLITNFNTYSDDNSELATTEIINVINKCLRKIVGERPWNFCKLPISATTDSNGYITLPTDFSQVAPNWAQDSTIWRPDTAVVYVGDPKIVFPIIPQDLAIQANFGQIYYPVGGFYNLINQYAYIDYANNRLVVNNQPNTTCYYSYKNFLPDITATTDTIPLPHDYVDVLLYAMLVDDTMIQKIDALKNLLTTNNNMYQEYLSNLRVWDSSLLNF